MIYRAGLDALLDTTVAFPATSVISYRLTVPSPTMISASPVMTLVANISMSMGPTGIGPHPLLLLVQLAVLPERRLNPVLTSSEQYIPLTMLNEMCGLFMFVLLVLSVLKNTVSCNDISVVLVF